MTLPRETQPQGYRPLSAFPAAGFLPVLLHNWVWRKTTQRLSTAQPWHWRMSDNALNIMMPLQARFTLTVSLYGLLLPSLNRFTIKLYVLALNPCTPCQLQNAGAWSVLTRAFSLGFGDINMVLKCQQLSFSHMICPNFNRLYFQKFFIQNILLCVFD